VGEAIRRSVVDLAANLSGRNGLMDAGKLERTLVSAIKEYRRARAENGLSIQPELHTVAGWLVFGVGDGRLDAAGAFQ
jgi:hypothetical protein